MDQVKEFVEEHQETIATTAAVAVGTGALYAGLTLVKIKYLVLAGLVVGTGMAAAAGYKAAEAAVNKLQEGK